MELNYQKTLILIVENKIPTVLTIAGNNEYIKANQPKFIYKNYFSSLKGGEKLAEYLISTMGKKNFGILVMNVPYALECVDGFNKIYTKQGGIITVTEKFKEHEPDTRSLIEKYEGQHDKNLAEYVDDTSEKHKKMVDEIRDRFGLSSLRFNTVQELVDAIGLPKERLCTHCFDGSSWF